MSVCTSPSDEALVRRLVELTEAGLPLVADPWAWLADELGLEVGLLNPPRIIDGCLVPPDGPGWGAEWDMELFAKRTVAVL